MTNKPEFTEEDPNQAHLGQLGIGAMSRATGIPVETIRTWERRYNFPLGERTPAGHRVYSADTVEHLRHIARALKAGHRASRVVGLPLEELLGLLGGPGIEAFREGEPSPDPLTGALPAVVHDWIDAVLRLDEGRLDQGFRAEWSRLGAVAFLSTRATPFLYEVGRVWSNGELGIAHEHFASERLRDFLSAQWRPMAQHNTGPAVLCATLPDELHHLALHMTASVLAMSGLRVLFLGMSAPLEEIARASAQLRCRAVLISVSSAMDGLISRQRLLRLRELLPEEVELLVGGAGAPEKLPGVTYPASLAQLEGWSRGVAQEHSAL